MKHIRAKLICLYNFTLIICAMVFYYIIPILLNYGPGSINTEFDKKMSGGFYYYQQIILITGIISILITIVLLFVLKKVDNYAYYKENYLKTKSPKDEKELNKIKKICFAFPNQIFLAFIIVPIILELVLLLSQAYTSSTDFKLVLIIFIVTTIAVSIDNIYAKKLFSSILADLENVTLPTKKGKLIYRLLLQIIPIITVGIVFTFLAVSSVYEKNKGELLSKYYSLQFKYTMDTSTINSTDDLIKALQKINLYKDDNILFIANDDFEYIYSTSPLSDFFKEYAKEYALDYDNIIYDYYGTYGQGVIFPTTINGDTVYIGAHYLIYSSEMFGYMLLYILIIFVISIIILVYFSKELCKDINNIEDTLQNIYKNKKLNQNLYVTSNDELGELTIAINQIQKLNNEHLQVIQNSQDMLMEKERLASLGQLIGGISHNLKTPIMSISGATEGLTDLINEYEASIGDSDVTVEDHHAIASDMREWITKIHSYTSYMSDIITAVKGQAVNLSENKNDAFSIKELIDRVNILMKHEIRNASLTLNTKIDVPDFVTLHGDINSLVQVINNLITNAIQSYNGKRDDSIQLSANMNENNLVISVEDHGCGMTKEVQEKLFKTMITTKGKNGTGLGMFMSYSTIKGQFNGDITFTSDVGKGTTFYITIPLPKS